MGETAGEPAWSRFFLSFFRIVIALTRRVTHSNRARSVSSSPPYETAHATGRANYCGLLA